MMRKKGASEMVVQCLNCSHEQAIDENNTYVDELGEYTLCEKCESSFDIDYPAEECS